MSRAISITNSEISTCFFMVGLVMILVCFKLVWNLFEQAPHIVSFAIIMFLLLVSLLFFAMSMIWPNYLISKYHLNIFIDRITNPDYIGWLRFTRSKSFRSHIVKKGPLGQTMGVANGVKADVINQGDYTVTLMNGNQCIIKHDMLSHNVNLEQNENWELIKKHHGTVGFDAWEKAVDENEMLFEIESPSEEDADEEEGETEEEIQS